jgi:hypothetical protein
MDLRLKAFRFKLEKQRIAAVNLEKKPRHKLEPRKDGASPTIEICV